MIMGLDRYQKTPCGFCFVEFHHRESTEDALRLISGCKLDERIIRVGEAWPVARALPLPRRRRRCSRCASCAASPCADWDGGFVEGRQYGRGRSGGQVPTLASTLTLSLGPDPKPRHLREHSPRASLSRCSLMAPRPDLRPEDPPEFQAVPHDDNLQKLGIPRAMADAWVAQAVVKARSARN